MRRAGEDIGDLFVLAGFLLKDALDDAMRVREMYTLIVTNTCHTQTASSTELVITQGRVGT